MATGSLAKKSRMVDLNSYESRDFSLKTEKYCDVLLVFHSALDEGVQERVRLREE